MDTIPEKLSADRLALVYRLSQAFNSTLQLDEVLDRVMDEVIGAFHAERGFVMLREDHGQLVFKTARGMDRSTIEDPGFQISRGVVEEVARDRQPLLTFDALRDERFSSRVSVQGLRLRSILCAPLMAKEKLIGVVYLDNRLQAGIFTQADLDLMTVIASSAAVAIENARLYQIAVEKSKLERELSMARQVQASLLPHDLPDLPGWGFSARWLPAREVAGDFFDFLFHGQAGVGMLVADVTDKGLPAALFMVISRSALRDALEDIPDPAEAITRANRVICNEAVNAMYVSMFYARLDPGTGTLWYVNAGHNPAFYYQAATDQFFLLKPTGMMLGMDEDSQYRAEKIQLQAGDFVFMYTDGVTDAMSGAEEYFGMERLSELIQAQRAQPPQELLDLVSQELTGFIGEAPLFDDTTMMAVKRF